MSRFLSSKYDSVEPYVPGEQPKDMRYVKLNTNENPFPPCKAVMDAVADAAQNLQLYPDPEGTALIEAFSGFYKVAPNEMVLSNGSDELLNFAFMAFCDDECPARFADITYGFYPVSAGLNGVRVLETPLRDDFTIDIDDYCKNDSTVFIANPNAPTGIPLTIPQIRTILEANPDHVVVIDEAYVDFGAESCVQLIHEYDNLLVIQTCSKSRSMAGARLGFAFACKELICDLNTIRNSINPYNISRMALAAGIASIETYDYTASCCAKIMENREFLVKGLKELGFEVLPSKANFVFARHDKVSGETVYKELKKKGVLVRHFTKARISDFVRISIGSAESLEILLAKLKEVLSEA